MKKFYRWDGSNLVLSLQVRARARRFAWRGIRGAVLQVDVPAVPEQGRATDELLRHLAEEFAVRSAAVRLISGAFQSRKVVCIISPTRLPHFIDARPGTDKLPHRSGDIPDHEKGKD